ncbi:MAG: glycosyltransferase family 2 protein [Prevotella sp.]|jgi:glycosyltransferase involved in cell wall biosynthesis
MKFLSIIIPLYNAERYIVRCIESCYHQGLDEDDFEVIVVNDGSRDQSYMVASELVKQHSNLVVIDKDNEGVGLTRNRGLQLAQGEYVAFLDSDDYYLDDSLSPLLSLLRSYNLDILYFRVKMVREWDDKWSKTDRGYEVEKNRVLAGEEAFYQGFLPSSMCNCFFKKKIAEDHYVLFSSVRNGEDSEFSCKITAYADKVMFVDQMPYIYYLHSHSELEKESRSNIHKIYDSLSISKSLIGLSDDLKIREKQRLAEFIYKMALRIRFGAMNRFWKDRKVYKREGLLKDIIIHLQQMGYFPLHGPYPSWKHCLCAKLLINNPLFYK